MGARRSDHSGTYYDAVGDTDVALDIASVTVSHVGGGLTFRVAIVDLGPGLVEGDFLAVTLNTDRNSHTGCDGGEIVLAALGGTAPTPDVARFGRCVSGNWNFKISQAPFSASYASSGSLHGPGSITFHVTTAAVGTTNFGFDVGSLYSDVYGDDADMAGPYVFREGQASSQSKAAVHPQTHRATAASLRITKHVDVRAEATGPHGAKVGYSPARVTGAKSVTYSRRSGSVFPLGRTVVTVTARNAKKTVRSKFVVSVVDTTAPTITLPANISTSTTTGVVGATVTYGPVQATDRVDGTTAATCSPASGTVFAPGGTQVSCTATDRHGNDATAGFTVSVPLLSEPLASVQTNTSLQYDGTMITGASTAITISAPNNPLGDVPTYTWKTSSGTIVGSGLSATWTRTVSSGQLAPGLVTVTVTHPAGGASHAVTLQFT